MNHPPNYQADAKQEALDRLRERMANVNLLRAAARGGLDFDAKGRVEVIFLGRTLLVAPGSLDVTANDGKKVSATTAYLVLRYLETEREVHPLGEDITFRDLPGGRFYLSALAQRTTEMLLKAYGNNTERLRQALSRYPHEPLAIGDISARIHAIGRLDVTLVYRAGDDEFPATMDLLYDKAIGGIYSADEVAALTTALCFGLL